MLRCIGDRLYKDKAKLESIISSYIYFPIDEIESEDAEDELNFVL